MTKTLLLSVAITLFTAGCATPPPMRIQTDAERQAMFQKLSGVFKVEDDRLNYQKTVSLVIRLADMNGQVATISESGQRVTYPLRKCEIANRAQATNLGDPPESVEELVLCYIDSEYRHSHLYLGKVKSDFVRKNGAILKIWSPINIKNGYIIEFVPTTGVTLFDASKVSN
jgi:hypothetical protein